MVRGIIARGLTKACSEEASGVVELVSVEDKAAGAFVTK
jgi:hypothetical protein